MTAPRDDDLTAMLESRADRMPVAAGREVLASVRDEIRGPKSGAAFSVLPVKMTRGMNGPVGWAAIGLVAVLVLAVMGGRLDTEPSAPAGSTGGPGSLVASAEPSASQLAGEVRRLERDRLILAVKSGDLDGELIVIQGTAVETGPCVTFGPAPCLNLAIEGLGGIDVSWDGPWYESVRSPTSIVGELVVTPRNGALVLLGRLAGDLDRPSPLQDELDQRRLMSRRAPFVLTAVTGWLVVGGVHGCARATDSTPCPVPPPRLTDVEPYPDGILKSTVEVEVGVLESGPGIDIAQVVTPGPFLYRTVVGSTCRDQGVVCAGGPTWSWEIVARYDLDGVHRVVLP